LLRRSGASAELLRFAAVELDLSACQARRAGRRLPVTKTELALLELFLPNPGRVLSRTQIFESVWGYDFGPESNGLWGHISYLRRKLGEPRLIQSRGAGRRPGAGADLRARLPAVAGPRRSGRLGAGGRQPGRQRAEMEPARRAHPHLGRQRDDRGQR
jgi:hypothetical protein